MRINSETKHFASPISASLFLLFCVDFVIISLFGGGKTNIIVILRQKSETAHICGREHETSSMRPYANLSFRNDNHIVVNPSLSGFKCSIQGQNKVKLGQVPLQCTENMGPGYKFFFFENWTTGTSFFLLPSCWAPGRTRQICWLY